MNDEQLLLISAYKDGELDAVQEALARQLIDRDVNAQRYYEDLLALDRWLHSALDPVLVQPLPAALQAAIKPPARRHPWRLFTPLALAASLVLVAVLVVRQDVLDQQMQEQLRLMQYEIAQLRNDTLENVPSGSAASWVAPVGETRAQVTPLKTYKADGDQFCREYEERIEDAAGVEIRRGIACRKGKRDWSDMAGHAAVPGGKLRL